MVDEAPSSSIEQMMRKFFHVARQCGRGHRSIIGTTLPRLARGQCAHERDADALKTVEPVLLGAVGYAGMCAAVGEEEVYSGATSMRKDKILWNLSRIRCQGNGTIPKHVSGMPNATLDARRPQARHDGQSDRERRGWHGGGF